MHTACSETCRTTEEPGLLSDLKLVVSWDEMDCIRRIRQVLDLLHDEMISNYVDTQYAAQCLMMAERWHADY